MSHMENICFNCQRSENEIPVLAWRYKGKIEWVCSECMPLLIHKWQQIAPKMQQPEE